MPTLDHGPVAMICPAWCVTDHAVGRVGYRADLTHEGPGLSLTVPSRNGSAEWLYTGVDQGPFSGYDRSVGVVVEVCGGLSRHTPASLRALADVLAVQLDEVRGYANRVERLGVAR